MTIDNNISSSVPGPEVELGATFVADKTSPVVDRPVVSDGLDDPEAGNVGNKRGLLYKVNEWCPLHVGLVYGFQQLAESAASMVGTSVLMWRVMCGDDPLQFAELMNAMLFTMGFSSLFEIWFGFRLPVMEGPSFAFLAPVLAMGNIPSYRCLPSCKSMNITLTGDMTTSEPPACEDNAYESRLREVAGSVMCAGMAQFLLGITGGIGLIVNYVSSLTVAVTIMMLGIGLYPSLTIRASAYWPAALVTVSMYVLFALILGGYRVPLPAWNRKRRFHVNFYPIFRLFPSLFAIGIGWLFCYILTISGALTDDSDSRSYAARTDIKTDVLKQAEWIIIPYPGRIGAPTFGVGLFVGFLGSVVASTFESIGDYYNTAQVCEEPPPPKHAVNRGIAVEGVCSMLSGSIGGVLGTTTYSDVAGVIPVTGVASRLAWTMVGFVFLGAGILGKMTAAIAMCPDPVIAGFNIFNFGIMTTMGLANLQNVDMKSVRNLVILAVSIMIGLTVPQYSKTHIDELDTGNTECNQVIQILLTSNMFVGGVTTFILDNLVPGTKKERGILTVVGDSVDDTDQADIDKLDQAYGLPYVTKWMRRRRRFFGYVPFLPP